MTLRKIYFGSIGPFLFDDADAIDDPDGDFAGETQKAIRSSSRISVDDAPVDDVDVVRKTDLSGGNVTDGDKLDIDWDPSYYVPDSSITQADDADDLSAHLKGIDDALGSGVSSTITVITAMQNNSGTIEYKTKDLTFTNGKLTTEGTESGWTAA
jgi:hypothetical protein